jgi:hypothetical protein
MKLEQCTSLQATEEDSLQTSFSDISQLSLLSGMDMPAKSSENAPQTDGFPDCKCGKGTLDCSIHPSTPEKWTAFMRDSLAKTLALLENRQVYLREPDQVFTEKSCVSLAWFDQSSCSWKTSQQSLVMDWEPYSETWPRWGMTVGGSAFVHPMSERRITETDGFYWDTPRTTDIYNAAQSRKSPASDRHQLREQVFWPTPRANSAMAATITPESAWDRKRFPNLETVVGQKMWPTPNASDCRDRGNMSLPSIQRRAAIGKQLNLSMVVHPTSGQLNPDWVEWLMGFPIGFTVSKDWETRKSPSKLQQLIDSLEEVSK